MSVVFCQRCGKPCKASAPVNPGSRLLQRTSAPDGLCPNCAVTSFMMSVETIKYGIELRGVEAVLSNQAVRDQFVAVMIAGSADMKPEEIDWQAIIANWNLPLPKRGTTKASSRRATYRNTTHH